ncbi:MAG TPA: TSUP family transporter, partial [Terriglobales bacterium]|nr:TSUP family transporter [Terriglobales bacterium]
MFCRASDSVDVEVEEEAMMLVIALLVGVLIGALSGLIGLGGGVLLIPILVYFFGMNQHQAQGTSLAML